MELMLSLEEIKEIISYNKCNLPSIDEIHFDIWQTNYHKLELMMSLIYRNPNSNVLKMQDYQVYNIACIDTEHEIPLFLQKYGNETKKNVKRLFGNKRVTSNFHIPHE